jgi:hypothetical protein
MPLIDTPFFRMVSTASPPGQRRDGEVRAAVSLFWQQEQT